MHQKDPDTVPQNNPSLRSLYIKFLNTIFKHQRGSLKFCLNPYLTQLYNLGPIWAKIMQPYVPGYYVSWLAH